MNTLFSFHVGSSVFNTRCGFVKTNYMLCLTSLEVIEFLSSFGHMHNNAYYENVI